jgi:hypothetical protein
MGDGKSRDQAVDLDSYLPAPHVRSEVIELTDDPTPSDGASMLNAIEIDSSDDDEPPNPSLRNPDATATPQHHPTRLPVQSSSRRTSMRPPSPASTPSQFPRPNFGSASVVRTSVTTDVRDAVKVASPAPNRTRAGSTTAGASAITTSTATGVQDPLKVASLVPTRTRAESTTAGAFTIENSAIRKSVTTEVQDAGKVASPAPTLTRASSTTASASIIKKSAIRKPTTADVQNPVKVALPGPTRIRAESTTAGASPAAITRQDTLSVVIAKTTAQSTPLSSSTPSLVRPSSSHNDSVLGLGKLPTEAVASSGPAGQTEACIGSRLANSPAQSKPQKLPIPTTVTAESSKSAPDTRSSRPDFAVEGGSVSKTNEDARIVKIPEINSKRDTVPTSIAGSSLNNHLKVNTAMPATKQLKGARKSAPSKSEVRDIAQSARRNVTRPGPETVSRARARILAGVHSSSSSPGPTERVAASKEPTSREATTSCLESPIDTHGYAQRFTDVNVRLKKYVQEAHEAHAYFVKACLRRNRECFERDARSRKRSLVQGTAPKLTTAHNFHQESSPFRKTTIQTPVEIKGKHRQPYFEQEIYSATSLAKKPISMSQMTTSSTLFQAKAIKIPAFREYVNLQDNVLMENVNKLGITPYFESDNYDEDIWNPEFIYELKEKYKQLPRWKEDNPENHEDYITDIQDFYGPSIEAFFSDIGIKWGDVLFWLLASESDSERVHGQQHDSSAFEKLLQGREPHLPKRFDRNNPKWQDILAKLPAVTLEQLSLAALACSSFLKQARFNIWYMTKHSHFRQVNIMEKLEGSSQGSRFEYQSAACRVCQL